MTVLEPGRGPREITWTRRGRTKPYMHPRVAPDCGGPPCSLCSALILRGVMQGRTRADHMELFTGMAARDGALRSRQRHDLSDTPDARAFRAGARGGRSMRRSRASAARADRWGSAFVTAAGHASVGRRLVEAWGLGAQASTLLRHDTQGRLRLSTTPPLARSSM